MDTNEPIHEYFGLSYANYLVLRRSVLQSAPLEWQQRFVKMLEELEELFGQENLDGRFVVSHRDAKNRASLDPIPHYERGRTRIPLKEKPL